MHTRMHLCVFLSTFCKLAIFSFYSNSNHYCRVSIEQFDLNGDIQIFQVSDSPRPLYNKCVYVLMYACIFVANKWIIKLRRAHQEFANGSQSYRHVLLWSVLCPYSSWYWGKYAHYDDVTWMSRCHKSPIIQLLIEQLIQTHIKETSKPVLLALCEGNSLVTAQRASNALKASILWCDCQHAIAMITLVSVREPWKNMDKRTIWNPWKLLMHKGQNKSKHNRANIYCHMLCWY